MTDRFNPEIVGNEIIDFSRSGVLNSSNPEDTFLFTLPVTANSDDLDIFYDYLIFDQDLDDPVTIVIGEDINNNGIFDTDEEIGVETFNPDDVLGLIGDFYEPGEISPIEDNVDLLLQPGQDYFVEVQAQDLDIDNNYSIDFNAEFTGVGEINTNDSFYCCNENDKYYFDDLNDLVFRAGESDVNVGDEFEIEIVSRDFEPVIFVLNEDTGDVIDVGLSSEQITLGNSTYNSATINLTVEGNISYLLSIETAQPEQTGTYLFIPESSPV